MTKEKKREIERTVRRFNRDVLSTIDDDIYNSIFDSLINRFFKRMHEKYDLDEDYETIESIMIDEFDSLRCLGTLGCNDYRAFN